MFSKTLAFLSLLIILVSCSSSPPSEEAMRKESEMINEFFEEQFEQRVARYPTWQTYLGRKTNYGKLDNETEAYGLEDHKLDQQALKELKKFDYDLLKESEKLSYKLFEYELESSLESFKWRYHTYPLNQMFGYQSGTPSFLINMHRVDDKKDAKAYISRLEEIKRVFDERMVFLKKQELLGIHPPNFVFDKVIEDSKNIISGAPFKAGKGDSPLLEDFKNKVGSLQLSKKEKEKLVGQAKKALLDSVRPAYNELIAYVKDLDEKVSSNQGAWSLPDGEDFYEFKLSQTTTTDLSANEIHETGLKEVKRIHKEMRDIMKEVGFEGSLQEFFTYMKGDRFLYPSTKAGRKAYLKDANEIIANMEKELPKLFKTFPKAELLVKPVEAYREKSAGIAFYTGPSLEGNRPGIYYVNLYKMADNPKYKMEALAYHEALPGHHMQIAISKELEDLPTFRRTGGFTAYIEGWGLYAELLPKEIGFYTDPYSDFGRLSMELWRATRLVVDTGIHSKKWSREKAISYLENNTPNSELEIMKGVERYFVMPSQATAYKVGMLKILELREKAKRRLGDKFDLPEFHDVILRDGALPLFMLEDKVESWIESSN